VTPVTRPIIVILIGATLWFVVTPAEALIRGNATTDDLPNGGAVQTALKFKERTRQIDGGREAANANYGPSSESITTE
jgi:hypothetical protein